MPKVTRLVVVSGCECQYRAQVGVKPARKFGNASRKNEVYSSLATYPRKFPGQFLRQTNLAVFVNVFLAIFLKYFRDLKKMIRNYYTSSFSLKKMGGAKSRQFSQNLQKKAGNHLATSLYLATSRADTEGGR